MVAYFIHLVLLFANYIIRVSKLYKLFWVYYSGLPQMFNDNMNYYNQLTSLWFPSLLSFLHSICLFFILTLSFLISFTAFSNCGQIPALYLTVHPLWSVSDDVNLFHDQWNISLFSTHVLCGSGQAVARLAVMFFPVHCRPVEIPRQSLPTWLTKTWSQPWNSLSENSQPLRPATTT